MLWLPEPSRDVYCHCHHHPRWKGRKWPNKSPVRVAAMGMGLPARNQSYRDPASARGRQPRVEQERQGSTQLPLSAPAVSYCLPNAKASGKPADKEDSRQTVGVSLLVAEQRRVWDGRGGWGRE